MGIEVKPPAVAAVNRFSGRVWIVQPSLDGTDSLSERAIIVMLTMNEQETIPPVKSFAVKKGLYEEDNRTYSND
jgi:hypothetical protein